MTVPMNLTTIFTKTHWPIEEPSVANPPDQPRWIVVREIDLAPIGSPYPFVYRGPDKRHPIANFNSVMQSIIDGRYQRNGTINHYFRPMDLKLSEPTRFVFYLGDRWPWRFTHKTEAATLSHPDSNVRKYYTGLRHVIDTPAGSPTPFTHDKFCRIIYFDASQSVTPHPAGTTFNHPFNLIIEFFYPDGDPDNAGVLVPNTIPIIVDPDVRYPGGSGQ